MLTERVPVRKYEAPATIVPTIRDIFFYASKIRGSICANSNQMSQAGKVQQFLV
jgi:hypothetical protein